MSNEKPKSAWYFIGSIMGFIFIINLIIFAMNITGINLIWFHKIFPNAVLNLVK